MLISLEMHLGFETVNFLKNLMAMVGEIYQGEFFMHVLDRSVVLKL